MFAGKFTARAVALEGRSLQIDCHSEGLTGCGKRAPNDAVTALKHVPTPMVGAIAGTFGCDDIRR